jgi:hypothetical protein
MSKKSILIRDLKVGMVLRHIEDSITTLEVTKVVEKRNNAYVEISFTKTCKDGSVIIKVEEHNTASDRYTNGWYYDVEATDRLALVQDMKEIFNGT